MSNKFINTKVWTKECRLKTDTFSLFGSILTWLLWRLRNVCDEEGWEDSHGVSSIIYDPDIQEPVEYSNSCDMLFVGSQDGSDMLFPFTIRFSWDSVFSDFINVYTKQVLRKEWLMITIITFLGLGHLFSHFCLTGINVLTTGMSIRAESVSVTSVCHVLSHTVEKALLVSGFCCDSHAQLLNHSEKCCSHPDVPSHKPCPCFQSLLLASEYVGRSWSYITFYFFYYCICLFYSRLNYVWEILSLKSCKSFQSLFLC